MLGHLQKAEIVNTHTRERFKVMYNPEEYSLEEGNTFSEVPIPGLHTPPIQYVRGNLRSLKMELFFDTFEKKEDVRKYVGKIVSLLKSMPDTHAPPILLFMMGTFSFRCVLEEAGQSYKMFLPDGTPVRATVSVHFREYESIEIEVERGLFVGPPTVHNVVEGQTASDLAAQFLGDPRKWREIAKENDIDDPFRLPVGKFVKIPERYKR